MSIIFIRCNVKENSISSNSKTSNTDSLKSKTPKLSSDSKNNYQNSTNDKFFIISLSAVKKENEAKQAVDKLINQGYDANYLWIPDYLSLSGANYFLVYIGPFENQYDCEIYVEAYRKKNPKAYGILVSQENIRIHISGVNKIKITDPYHVYDELKELKSDNKWVNTPRCIEREEGAGYDNCVEIIKTCFFHDFKSVLNIGLGSVSCKPDGRLNHELFRIKNGNFIKVENSALFKKNKKELLNKINRLMKTEFKLEKNNLVETENCLYKMSPSYSFDNLGISFNDKSISFCVSLEISDSNQDFYGCGHIFWIEMPLEEIEPYLN